jgi:hypothetical protein
MKKYLLFSSLFFLSSSFVMAKDLPNTNNLNDISENISFQNNDSLSDDYNSNYIEIIKTRQMLPSLINFSNVKNRMAYGDFSNSQINFIKKQINNACNSQESDCTESKLVTMQFLTFIQTEDSENKGELSTYQNCLHNNYKDRKNYCYSYTNLYGATLLSSLLKDEMKDVYTDLEHTQKLEEKNKIFNIYQSHVNLFMHNRGFITQENLMINKIFDKALNNKYSHLSFNSINYANERKNILNLVNYNLMAILYSAIDNHNLIELNQNEKHSENKKDNTSCNYLFLFDPTNNNYSSCLIH